MRITVALGHRGNQTLRHLGTEARARNTGTQTDKHTRAQSHGYPDGQAQTQAQTQMRTLMEA
eukprot:11445651-Alexandrium_andersonii.AAC.1